MREYVLRETGQGTPLNSITRHMLGLLAGRPGAKLLRQMLSEDVRQGLEASLVFDRAIALVSAAGLNLFSITFSFKVRTGSHFSGRHGNGH